MRLQIWRHRLGGRAYRRKRAGVVERVWGVVVTVEVAVAVALAALTAGARVAGFETYDILSGSMEPNISVGSLIYARTHVSCERIGAGDVIVYDIGQSRTVTHRVLSADPSSQTFVTKGDANDSADPQPVPWGNVRGKVAGTVPKLGSVVSALTTRKVHFAVALAAFNALLCAGRRIASEIAGRP